jgi:hypothetical protein
LLANNPFDFIRAIDPTVSDETAIAQRKAMFQAICNHGGLTRSSSLNRSGQGCKNSVLVIPGKSDDLCFSTWQGESKNQRNRHQINQLA